MRARKRRLHQQPAATSAAAGDVIGCHGDGYVRCVISLVQAGADVSDVWTTFIRTFPSRRGADSSGLQPITFQQMVVCEVLTQVCIDTSTRSTPIL